MNWILKKILGSKNERDLKKLRPLVEKINEHDEAYKALTDEQLQAKTPEFKDRLANGELDPRFGGFTERVALGCGLRDGRDDPVVIVTEQQ